MWAPSFRTPLLWACSVAAHHCRTDVEASCGVHDQEANGGMKKWLCSHIPFEGTKTMILGTYFNAPALKSAQTFQ